MLEVLLGMHIILGKLEYLGHKLYWIMCWIKDRKHFYRMWCWWWRNVI